MQQINIHEAKTRLSAVLVQIEKTGERVVICRNGKPIAELGPIKKSVVDRLRKHPDMSKIKINYDPTEVLSREEWGEVE